MLFQPIYSMARVAEGRQALASASVRAYAPRPAGEPRVRFEDVARLVGLAFVKFPDALVAGRVFLASELKTLKGLADPSTARSIETMIERFGDLPSAEALDAIRDAFRLPWGPSVDSPPPQLTIHHLRGAVIAARSDDGKIRDEYKFLIAHEWALTPGRCKSTNVRRAYELLERRFKLPAVF